MPEPPAVPTCRVCGCTDERPCAGGCAWYLDDLCTLCALAAEAMAEWAIRAVRPDLKALSAEAKARAEALAEDDGAPLIVVVNG